MLSNEATKVLEEIIANEGNDVYWKIRFDGISNKEKTILRGCFNELKENKLINISWADDYPYSIQILKDGYLYKEKEMDKAISIESNGEDILSQLLLEAQDIKKHIHDGNYSSRKKDWLNDAEVYINKYLKKHELYLRMNSILFHRKANAFDDLFSCLKSVQKYSNNYLIKKEDTRTMNNGDKKVYDVFISHANKDKTSFVDDLKKSIDKLGIKVFYDTTEIEWGDNWKERIFDGTSKSEFAIIVVSENFFGREWTEKELNEFLNRQNSNGQKLILPILHNISIDQLKAKYPEIADIQGIESNKYTCDEIALLFAKQLIKRLKSY